MELHDQGTPLDQIAVLYRSHFHCMETQMELTRRNIPFGVTSGLRFFEQAHIKDVAAFLKFTINPGDEVAFSRMSKLIPGIGERSATKFWDKIRAGHSWGDMKVSEKSKKEWIQIGETLRQIGEGEEHLPPSERIHLVMEAFYNDHLKTKYSNYSSRIDDLHQLIHFAGEFSDTAEFLEQLSLMTNMESDGTKSDASGRGESVRLSTIHQAKGLEWKVVFIIMLCEGMFPGSRSIEAPDSLEEERRLFYVAVTRAMDELYLCYPEYREFRSGQGGDYQEPSRFVEECRSFDRWKIKQTY